jgi:hypothetical protein
MIVIYEAKDMIERARSKPSSELTLQDVDPRAVADPVIYIAAQGIAHPVKGGKQDLTEDYEIRIVAFK